METKTIQAHLPAVAPTGYSFKLKTVPNEVDRVQRYLHASKHGSKGGTCRLIITVLAQHAKTFTHLAIAKAFEAFVNNYHVFPHGPKFEIVIERDGYSGNSARLTTLAEA
jgi:hypothetical protein